MIFYIMQVIDRIHKWFFSNKRLREVDVRAILAAEQRQVLAGCCILFSRIFPVGEANPHVHPLWRMAEQFGATCCLNINDKVTHVVAISLGTDKVTFVTFSETPFSDAFGFFKYGLTVKFWSTHCVALQFLFLSVDLVLQVNWASATGRPVVRPTW